MEAALLPAQRLLPSDPWLKKWAVACRLPFLTASVLPVLATIAAVWRLDGHVNVVHALLAVIGIAFVHLSANLSNDYFDHLSGNDEVNRLPTAFSGGSRVIQEGIVTPRSMLIAAVACSAVGVACGIYLWLRTPGHVLLGIGLVGVGIAWLYVGPPVKFAHHGYGELATMLGFGVLPAMGTEWALRGQVTPEGSWVGVPAGLLVALILLINEFPDSEADAAVGKRTLVVRLGPRRAVWLYTGLLLAVYGAVAAGVLLGWMPWPAAATVGLAPLSAYIVRQIRVHYAEPRALVPAMAATIAQQVLFLAILSGACLSALALGLGR